MTYHGSNQSLPNAVDWKLAARLPIKVSSRKPSSIVKLFLEIRREIKKGDDQHALQIAPQDVLDMPVDPNEPTYCLCHQVSYGEMIGCDNPDVSSNSLTCNLPVEINPRFF